MNAIKFNGKVEGSCINICLSSTKSFMDTLILTVTLLFDETYVHLTF